MNTRRTSLFTAGLIAGMVSLASADVILFDDNYQNGLDAYTGGPSSTTIVSSPNPVFSGTSSMEWSGGNFSLAGVDGLGSFAEFPVLEFYRYKTSGATGQFTLRLGGGYTAFAIDNTTADDYITFDGAPGYNGASEQWFKVQIDIGGMIDDNVITTSNVQAIQTGNSSGTDTWYVDDMRKTVIPEPSSLLLLGLAGIAGMFALRRRK